MLSKIISKVYKVFSLKSKKNKPVKLKSTSEVVIVIYLLFPQAALSTIIESGDQILFQDGAKEKLYKLTHSHYT